MFVRNSMMFSRNPQPAPRVVIAMSGGVDSSVAAALLKQQGYDVIGMMLRLWSEEGKEDSNRCCTPDAMALARRVAAKLDIPFYAVDARQPFRLRVVQSLLDGYLGGVTPNPCLVCNREIRWGLLYERAQALGAEFFATGHYARLRRNDHGSVQLLRGLDEKKDQSYVLSVLPQEQLAHTLLPIGEYEKSAVRQLARDFDLPVAERADSQDLCFLAGGDYREFLRRHIPTAENPGPILDRAGQNLGEHRGLAFYTIGQRKGLEVPSPIPLFVLEKDTARNALVIGPLEQLGSSELVAKSVNWVAGSPPPAVVQGSVKIRYRAGFAPATITPLEGQRARAIFAEPLRDITPGQAAVFYDGEVCLGGGIIIVQR